MNRFHTKSSPEFLQTADFQQQNDPLEGVAANVKLLYKLLQDHTQKSRDQEDGRRPQRVAGMLTILDDIKSRIENSVLRSKRREAELRRCSTDLEITAAAAAVAASSNNVITTRPSTKDMKRAHEHDENHRLRRELAAQKAARTSLEKMFSGLGKEKEMIAAELAKKVLELNDCEEVIAELRDENEKLLEKARACKLMHCGGEFSRLQ